METNENVEIKDKETNNINTDNNNNERTENSNENNNENNKSEKENNLNINPENTDNQKNDDNANNEEEVQTLKKLTKLSPLKLEYPELQTRLIEEMIHYLYKNNYCHFNNYKPSTHYDITVFPNSFSKSLFNKAKFYNLAIQKTLSIISSKHYHNITDICNSFYKDSTTNNKSFSSFNFLLKTANHLTEQYNKNKHFIINSTSSANTIDTLNNTNFYLTKPSTMLINENVYSIDKTKKFIYFEKNIPSPNNINFSDNQFYSYFSSKYRFYYNITALEDPQVYHYEKTFLRAIFILFREKCY